MLPWWVAPSAIVAGKIGVRRAEVGGGYSDISASLAPPRRLRGVADNLKAFSARGSVVEERHAQC